MVRPACMCEERSRLFSGRGALCVALLSACLRQSVIEEHVTKVSVLHVEQHDLRRRRCHVRWQVKCERRHQATACESHLIKHCKCSGEKRQPSCAALASQMLDALPKRFRIERVVRRLGHSASTMQGADARNQTVTCFMVRFGAMAEPGRV
jgi:hypothetical protein